MLDLLDTAGPCVEVINQPDDDKSDKKSKDLKICLPLHGVSLDSGQEDGDILNSSSTRLTIKNTLQELGSRNKYALMTGDCAVLKHKMKLQNKDLINFKVLK